MFSVRYDMKYSSKNSNINVKSIGLIRSDPVIKRIAFIMSMQGRGLVYQAKSKYDVRGRVGVGGD